MHRQVPSLIDGSNGNVATWMMLGTVSMALERMRAAGWIDHRLEVAAKTPGLAAATQAARAAGIYPLQNWASIARVTNWTRAAESLRRQVQSNLPRFPLGIPDVGGWVDRLRTDGTYPPNWPERMFLADVASLAAVEGIPLCWVPSANVIKALLAVEPHHRREVLLRQRGEVLQDCLRTLAEVLAPELDEFRRAAGDLLAAMWAGHDRPGQAYAMNIVDATLRGTLFSTVPKNGFYRPMIEVVKASRDCTLQDLRHSATLWPLLRMFDQFHPDRGDRVPALANRHATAHTVSRIQYKPVNALIATMVAVSLLREAQHTLDVPEPQQRHGAAEAEELIRS
ncbi:hypothetical protein O7627_32485 [Solwaraspora sp. WMMD1047]|uniref:hypothetical protein n=1 Tax=Solwaraspora sp. WMMD1047 TaxID=3016102 RepID=UPI002417EFBD|nr:hypothetical protein [Solwaraspora sp. WMMD1047]MDG4833990.1 hypothetical protein [Solwaraspora sp. WMMD1047]